MRSIIIASILLLSNQIIAQKTSISYELNGRLSNTEIQDSLKKSQNPFAKFIGEWTLKEDTWIQNWGNNNDTIKIPQHHTLSCQINTENSLISIVDGPEPNGHIFWSYNPNTKKVGHLSSFGSIRTGTGDGAFYGENNLRLKVSFEGEAPGTYRIYTYEWISDTEYYLNSVQFDENDQATGLFYKGNFIRINSNARIKKEIEGILNILDDHQISKEEQLSVYSENIIHMAPNHGVIENKKDLLAYLNQQKEYGYSDMEHKIVEFSQHENVVIMRGEVKGTFYPSNGGEEILFLTKNLFVFERIEGALKISKVIYNASPNQ